MIGNLPYLEALVLQSFAERTTIEDIELRSMYFQKCLKGTKTSNKVKFMLSVLTHAFSTWKITIAMLKLFYNTKIIQQRTSDDSDGIDQLSFQQLTHAIEYQNMPSKDGSTTLDELIVRASAVRVLYVERLSQILLEQENCHHLKTDDLKDISELSVIDASYCLKFQRIDTSLLNCPITPIIHQVFSALEMSFCLNGKLKQASF